MDNLVPWLIAAYVAFGLISAIAKMVRQAGKQVSASRSPGAAAPVQPPASITAEQVRAALARRRSAQTVAAVASNPMPQAPVAPSQTSPAGLGLQSIYVDSGSQGSSQTSMGPYDAQSAMPLAPALASLFTSLPPAAVAILATAVIGPCAAHRGAGHQPEDW